MSNRNRHMQYRKSIYRKNRVKLTLIISLCAVAALFILFLVVGNLLHAKTEPDDSNEGDGSKQTEQNTSTLPAASNITAYALPLLEEGTLLSGRLSAIDASCGAVSIALNNADGTLLFKPQLALSLPHLRVDPQAASLSSSISQIDQYDFYTAGILYIPAADSSQKFMSDVELSVLAAIASEALDSGVDDIMLVCRSATAESVSSVVSVAERIRANIPTATVGFALTDSILSAENRESLIDRLSKSFSYLAVDTTQSKDEDTLTHIENRISNMQYMIMYYKMRVLLPSGADAQQNAAYAEKAKEYYIQSWQMLPQ